MIKGFVRVENVEDLKYPVCIKGAYFNGGIGLYDTCYERVDGPNRINQLLKSWELFYLDETPAEPDSLQGENARLREALEEAETHLTIPFEPGIALHWVREAIKLIK